MPKEPAKKDLLARYGLLNDMKPAVQPGISPGRTTFSNTIHQQAKNAYSNDVLAGKKEFLAIVLRDENYYTRDRAPLQTPQGVAPHLFASDSVKLIKVRAAIPEIHAALPRPKDSEQHAIIDMYPVFTCSRDVTAGRQPAVGDIIRVTYGDLKSLSQPTIVGLVSNGNKQPGTQAISQRRCDGTIREAMSAKAAAGAALETPNLSRAQTTSTTANQNVDNNLRRAVRVSQEVERITGDKIPVEVLLGFMAIESKGKADAIRFEPHIFVGKGASWMKLNGKRGRPELKGAAPDKVPYTRPSKSPYYSRVFGETNKKAFESALRVDPVWAVYSTSFGTYQVMGFNILTDNNTKFLGLNAEEFYNKFKANPEEVSDDTIIRWITKKRAWRNIAKEKNPKRPLNDSELRELIKYYNGAGQIEAYFSRIGGGLKKAYEKAILTVNSANLEAAVSPEPAPPLVPPPSPTTQSSPPEPAQEGQPAVKIEADQIRARAQQARIEDGCVEEIVTRLAPKPKPKRKKATCTTSVRVADVKKPDQKKPTPTEVKTSTWDRHTNKRIQKLHPKIRQMVINFITDAQDRGYKLRVTSGLRTFQEQQALYSKGRPNGKKVTNARPGTSFHNYGLAIDVVEIGPTKGMNGFKKGYDKTRWDEIGKIGKEHGFFWGGDFRSLSDKPHFEFNNEKKLKIRGPNGLLEKYRANKKDDSGYVII
jgi:LAS superfamily LD-carboxypeptidase LdcB